MTAPVFVNQGSDPRPGGALGHLLAWLQRGLSFRSPHEPTSVVLGSGRWQLMLACSVPKSLPYISIAAPRWSTGRFLTLRFGWRYDKNWKDEGDGIEAPGGYFPDVLVKLRQTQIVHYVLLVAIVSTLTACAAKQRPPIAPVTIVETQEVQVPVPVKVVPPAELFAPLRPALPTFVAPEDPGASSALTVEGERLFRALVQELLTRIAAWQAWAAEPP